MTLRENAHYYIPPRKAFDELALKVCTQALQRGYIASSNPDVVAGLADFLYFLAGVTAKHLNAGQDDLLDNNRREE
jgi:hypothetical protein